MTYKNGKVQFFNKFWCQNCWIYSLKLYDKDLIQSVVFIYALKYIVCYSNVQDAEQPVVVWLISSLVHIIGVTQ